MVQAPLARLMGQLCKDGLGHIRVSGIVVRGGPRPALAESRMFRRFTLPNPLS